MAAGRFPKEAAAFQGTQARAGIQPQLSSSYPARGEGPTRERAWPPVGIHSSSTSAQGSPQQHARQGASCGGLCTTPRGFPQQLIGRGGGGPAAGSNRRSTPSASAPVREGCKIPEERLEAGDGWGGESVHSFLPLPPPPGLSLWEGLGPLLAFS